MVSISSLSSGSLAGALELLRPLSADTPQSHTLAASKPNVQVGSSLTHSALGDLIAKLNEIKSGALSGAAAEQGADQPLSSAGRAAEKSKWEAFYKGNDDDIRAHFSGRVIEAMLQNDLYKNDPAFQAALKNGTVKVQHGEDVGLRNMGAEREILYNAEGYCIGVGDGAVDLTGFKDLIETVDGKYVAKADGKHAAIGGINGMPFYVTW